MYCRAASASSQVPALITALGASIAGFTLSTGDIRLSLASGNRFRSTTRRPPSPRPPGTQVEHHTGQKNMAAKAVSAVALALLGTAFAQLGGWRELQVNSTMCSWRLPRGETPRPRMLCLPLDTNGAFFASVVMLRDAVYLDGGELIWFQGLEIRTTTPYTHPECPFSAFFPPCLR